MSGKQDQIGLNWIQLDEKGLNKVKNLHCTVDKFSETSEIQNVLMSRHENKTRLDQIGFDWIKLDSIGRKRIK